MFSLDELSSLDGKVKKGKDSKSCQPCDVAPQRELHTSYFCEAKQHTKCLDSWCVCDCHWDLA